MANQFDQYNDTPNQITNEGEQITVRFKRLTQTTGVISWNIPKNTNGNCTDAPMYNGILLTLDQTPTKASKYPVDGTVYNADPSGDPDTHLGDKIDTSLVVGFYRDDLITSSSVVTDLDPTKNYFISAYALSNILTYHTYGVHTYSVTYGDELTSDTTATQLIGVGEINEGVQLHYPTGFDVTKSYTLEATLNYDKKHTFTFMGQYISTYGDLINEWNRQAMLVDSPLQSPVIPNIGMLYYNNQKQELSQWNGTKHIPLTVFVDNEQPNILSIGDTWYNPTTKILKELITVQPFVWTTSLPYIILDHDPQNVLCGDLWRASSDVFKWSGSSWLSVPFFSQLLDPSLPPTLDCSTYWFDDRADELFVRSIKCSRWNSTLAQVSETDPTTPPLGHLWFNETTNQLNEYNGTEYVVNAQINISNTQPTTTVLDFYWYNPGTMVLKQYDGTTYTERDFLLWETSPLIQNTGALWWDTNVDIMYQWDDSIDNWSQVSNFFLQPTDPSLPMDLQIGTIWTSDDANYLEWDGSDWNDVSIIVYPTDPHVIIDGTYWFNKSTGIFSKYIATDWVIVEPTTTEDDPASPLVGSYWFDSSHIPSSGGLFRFDGTDYINVTFSPSSLTPSKGYTYYDTSLGKLRTWNGFGWIDGEPLFTVSLTEDGSALRLETSLTGSNAQINVGSNPQIMTGYMATNYANNNQPYVQDFFRFMSPQGRPRDPRMGGDGLQATPSYAQIGVGTDGSADERRELIDSIRHQFGYPTIEVELTKQQMNYAIDSALESLRKRSGMAYKRGFMFLDVEPRVQHYTLTNKKIGYNRIVEITQLHRVTSAFLAHPQSNGVQGQMALQQMYNMGSFDLISYHLVAQYVETMEQLFASKLNYMWNEDERKLSIFKEFYRKERVLMEVAVERTEQAMIKDRYLKSWIEKYAMVQCRLMLAEIRGKFGSLPGAGGGVTLNSGELSARADVELMELYDQIDNYLVNNPEEFGGQILFG